MNDRQPDRIAEPLGQRQRRLAQPEVGRIGGAGELHANAVGVHAGVDLDGQPLARLFQLVENLERALAVGQRLGGRERRQRVSRRAAKAVHRRFALAALAIVDRQRRGLLIADPRSVGRARTGVVDGGGSAPMQLARPLLGQRLIGDLAQLGVLEAQHSGRKLLEDFPQQQLALRLAQLAPPAAR